MKKLVSYIVCIALLFGTVGFWSANVRSQQLPIIELTAAEGKKGDVVTIDVVLKDNPGFIAAMLTVTFNNQALELISVSDNDFWKNMTAHNRNYESPYYLSWAGDTLLQNYSQDGVLVTLGFRIKETATPGKTYEIMVSYDYDNYDIMNFELESLYFETKSGSIEVQCAHTNTIHIPELLPTCMLDGYTAGEFCSDCQTYISGHEVVLSRGMHIDADGQWDYDANGHFYVCQCGEMFEKTAHVGNDATCVSKAVCQICKAEYGATDATNHTEREIRNQRDASCGWSGYSGDTYCTDCGALLASGVTIPAVADHIAESEKWEMDEQKHWRICSCGVRVEEEEHRGGVATCLYPANCQVCGVVYGSSDADNHGQMELRDVRETTCGVSGYTGDLYCKDCGKKITAGKEIPAEDHVWENANCVQPRMCSTCGATEGAPQPDAHITGEWIVTEEATATTAGKKQRTCQRCGAVIQEQRIPSLQEQAQQPAQPLLPEPTPGEEERNTVDLLHVWLLIPIVLVGAVASVIVILVKKRR